MSAQHTNAPAASRQGVLWIAILALLGGCQSRADSPKPGAKQGRKPGGGGRVGMLAQPTRPRSAAALGLRRDGGITSPRHRPARRVAAPRLARWPRAFPADRAVSLRWLKVPPGYEEAVRVVHRSHPYVFRYPEAKTGGVASKPGAGPRPLELVLALPGWSARSGGFIKNLITGFRLGTKDWPAARRAAFLSRLLVMSVQDPITGGPTTQGDPTTDRANSWREPWRAGRRLAPIIMALAGALKRPLRLHVMGYSSGAKGGPTLAVALAGRLRKLRAIAWGAPATGPASVASAIAIGGGPPVPATALLDHGMHVLLLAAPFRSRGDKAAGVLPGGKLALTKAGKGRRKRAALSDVANTRFAQDAYSRLRKQGVPVSIQLIQSAKDVHTWHWGLIATRIYKNPRPKMGHLDEWPDYRYPNPELYRAMATFIEQVSGKR